MKKVYYSIGVVIIIIFVCGFLKNDYMTFKDRNCVVVDKIQSNGTYKHDGNFYLVLREERGIVFDIIVDAATYTQAKKDKIITFNLRQFDIKQTPKENILYFFGTIIVLIVGLISIAFLIYCIFTE